MPEEESADHVTIRQYVTFNVDSGMARTSIAGDPGESI